MDAQYAPLAEIEPVTLTGAHVRLEPLAREHLDGLVAAGADAGIWTWMPWRPHTHDDFARWLDDALRERDAGTQLPFAQVTVEGGTVVGSTRLMAISRENRRLEIGWTWLAPAAQRTPINTEAKYLLLRHSFEALGCLRVELKTDARNERSQRAIERIGAIREGVFRKHQRAQHGVQRDSVYYSIVDDEWPAVRARLESLLGRP